MKKKIGIIGGMGPLATADLFKKIVLLTDADSDQEHIHIIIDNNTNIPDRTDYILNGINNPLNELSKSAARLEKLGADCIIMPCNTAHYFYDDLVKFIQTPFLNMLEETAKYIRTNFPGRKVGLLSTEGTRQSQIYDRVFQRFEMKILKPSDCDQRIVSKAIYNLKEGCFDACESQIESVVENMKLSGMDICILGCTELPIIFSVLNTKCFTVDPTSILAESAIKYIGGEVKDSN